MKLISFQRDHYHIWGQMSWFSYYDSIQTCSMLNAEWSIGIQWILFASYLWQVYDKQCKVGKKFEKIQSIFSVSVLWMFHFDPWSWMVAVMVCLIGASEFVFQMKHWFIDFQVRRVIGLQGKVKLCGDRLFQVLFAVCTGRSKRQAEPTAVYPGNFK